LGKNHGKLDHWKNLAPKIIYEIEAIKEWPTLRNVTEVRSFMGLVDYY
jgi:hypothetical protein